MKNAIAKIRFFLIISLVSVGLFSCVSEENFPPETVLEYAGHRFFVIVDGNIPFPSMILDIGFQDGDGNLGNVRPDTTHNLFVHVFDVLTNDTIPMQITHNQGVDWEDWVRSFNVPDLGPGPLSGTFNIGFYTFDFPTLQQLSQNGIVQFKVYIYDRAGVRSNEVITPNIDINIEVSL